MIRDWALWSHGLREPLPLLCCSAWHLLTAEKTKLHTGVMGSAEQFCGQAQHREMAQKRDLLLPNALPVNPIQNGEQDYRGGVSRSHSPILTDLKRKLLWILSPCNRKESPVLSRTHWGRQETVQEFLKCVSSPSDWWFYYLLFTSVFIWCLHACACGNRGWYIHACGSCMSMLGVFLDLIFWECLIVASVLERGQTG